MKQYTNTQKVIFQIIEDHNLSLADLKKLLRGGLGIPSFLVDDWANGYAESDSESERKLYLLRDNLIARGKNKKYMKQLREYIKNIVDVPRVVHEKPYSVGSDYHAFERREWISVYNPSSSV